jgi:ferrous iron transport protein B
MARPPSDPAADASSPSERQSITIALAGNPNSGKTTVFNAMTGARQHVGNYPGVTVEKKEGHCTHAGTRMHVVDLPGTYSLTAYSVDEVVARDFIVHSEPDVAVHIIDASNLERNLYLTVELIELGAPLVLAFNMSDVAAARGVAFDLATLAKLLGAPIVKTVGHKGIGIEELLDTCLEVARGVRPHAPVHVDYGREVEAELAHLVPLLEGTGELPRLYGARWTAIKLLERDPNVCERVTDPAVLKAVEDAADRLRRHFGDAPEVILPDQRYGFISGACLETVQVTAQARHRLSDRIDAVVLNRALGIPLFLLLMYLVFHLTFSIGEAPMGWIESGFGLLGGWLNTLWPTGSESALRSLLVDGIIGGVGGVVVFLPNILLLFMAIAFLEDSGYMARAAFLMDRLMHKIGLHGKSFIPMLIGFGCTVPAIMATRTLENRRDRLTTMLVLPLMSCGARFPIYALIIPAFFSVSWRAPVLWLIYLIGVLLAVACAKLLRMTVFRGESTPFVMELPPYRLPTLRGVLIHTWERGWMYLRKAGTIILGISIVMWVLTSYPKKGELDRDYAALADQAAAEYIEKAEALGAKVGIGDLLRKAVGAQLATAEEQAKWHEHQAPHQQAAEARDAAVARLGQRPDGETLLEFLGLCDAIQSSRHRFRTAVAEGDLEQGTAEYALRASQRDAQLSRLSRAHPQLYPTAVRFLDQAQEPYRATLARLEGQRAAEELTHSVAGRIGHGLEPVLRPLGFDWKIATALIGAFAAKEVFVAQLGIVNALGEAGEGSDTLRQALRRQYTPLVGFCVMLFCLISAPCMATIATTRYESGAWRWAFLQLGGLTALAYLLTLLVYQVGQLLA